MSTIGSVQPVDHTVRRYDGRTAPSGKYVQKWIIPHLSECARLRGEVVDGVGGDPDHGGEAHADAHALGPLGVRVVLAVLDRLVREDVEYEHGLQCKGKISSVKVRNPMQFLSYNVCRLM